MHIHPSPIHADPQRPPRTPRISNPQRGHRTPSMRDADLLSWPLAAVDRAALKQQCVATPDPKIGEKSSPSPRHPQAQLSAWRVVSDRTRLHDRPQKHLPTKPKAGKIDITQTQTCADLVARKQRTFIQQDPAQATHHTHLGLKRLPRKAALQRKSECTRPCAPSLDIQHSTFGPSKIFGDVRRGGGRSCGGSGGSGG